MIPGDTTLVTKVLDLLCKTYDAIVQGMGQHRESSAGEKGTD